MKKLLFLPVFLLLSIQLFAQYTLVRIDTQEIPHSARINYLNIIMVEVEEGVIPSDYMPAVFNKVMNGIIGGIPARSIPYQSCSLSSNKTAYINVNHYEYNGESYWDRGNFIKVPRQWPAYTKYPTYIDVIFSADSRSGKPSYRLEYTYE